MTAGERAARGEEGKTYYVPADMTYHEWKAQYGAGEMPVVEVVVDERSFVDPEFVLKEEPVKTDAAALPRDNADPPFNRKYILEIAMGVEQGQPMSPEEAANGANPHLRLGREFQVICQRCVQVYELRRRGYDVTAMPKPSTGNTIDWGYECFVDFNGHVPRYTCDKTAARVMSELRAAPDDARYGIYVKWKGHNSGAHVFIAEKIGGIISYIDPQNPLSGASDYFSRGRPGVFGLWRLDNAIIIGDETRLKATLEVKKTP